MEGGIRLAASWRLVYPPFQSFSDPLDFIFENVHCLGDLLGIFLAGKFFQTGGSVKGGLGRKVSHGPFQPMGEALQVMRSPVVDGVMKGFHLLGKVVKKQQG